MMSDRTADRADLRGASLAPPRLGHANPLADTSLTFPLRVFLISDRRGWSDRATEVSARLGAVPERRHWATANRIRRPSDSMMLDVSPPFAPRRLRLATWARWGWQPICLVSVAAAPGAARLKQMLDGIGYRSLLVTSSTDAYWQRLDTMLQQILHQRAVLVAQAARALQCSDPSVVDALSCAWQLLPQHRSVEHWSVELGLARRQQLEVFFAEHGLPHPKKVLEWLQLLQVVDFAERSLSLPKRDTLAFRFNYPNGDYLGRRAKLLSGESFRRLVAGGVKQVLSHMRSDCSQSRGHRQPH